MNRAQGGERLWKALGYSLAGLRAAFRHEAAFRQELVLVGVGTPLALWWGANGLERALLVASLWWIPIVELLNSGLEAVVDRIGPERHPLSGRAKDLGSAAVLLSLCLAAVVWALVLLPHWM